MFERIVQWNAEGREDTNFILGSTGEVLQGLGANESDIYMRSGEIEKTLQEHKEMTLEENKEALIKSSAVDGGSFSPNLALTKNLSPSTLVDLIRASLILNKNHWFLLRMRSGALAEKRAYKTKVL